MISCVKSLKSVAVAIALMMPCVALAADGAGARGITDSVVSTIVGGSNGDGATDATTAAMTALRGGIARDSAGNLYYTEGNRIVKQTGAALSVLGGQSVSGNAAEGVKAANARFNTPTLLAVDASNNIYVFDSGNLRIRKIDTNLIVTTVVGNGDTAGGQIADIGRVGTDVRLPNGIVGMAVNAAGDIFFASSSTNCIYKVAAADKKLSLVGGDGTLANSRSGSSIVILPLGGSPRDLALLADGTLIFSSSTGSIRNVKADGTSVVIAGVLDTTVAAPGNDVVIQSALYPDDGTKDALQSITATVTLAQVGGCNPGALAVDGSTIFFQDLTENRIRSFTVGGKIRTVFGEVSERGQTSNAGFRGEGTIAAPSTPRLGVVVTAGPNGFLDSFAGGDDVTDFGTRPNRIFAGPNNTSDTTVAGDDVQVVAPAAAATDDQTPRNDDPRHRISLGRLVAAGGVVTFIDDGNAVVRQATVGANVATIAGVTNSNRRNNLGVVNNHPKNSTNNPIPALGAPISAPSQIARDAAGNLFFDANDIIGNHNIWKYDGAAKTISVAAGRVVTNGYSANVGDGGPAATAKLTGLGSQVAVLADGTKIFADSNPQSFASSNTVRAINPAGVISTIAGIPNVSVTGTNGAPDVDYSTVNAAGNPVNSGRVGQKATDIGLAFPFGISATSTSDFLIADDFFFLVVAGGVVTVERRFGGQLNGVNDPAYVVPVSATVAIVGDLFSTRLVRVDYTNPAAVDTTVATNSTGPNIRGLVIGTAGGTPALFVLSDNQIDILDPATLAPIYGTAPTVADLTAAVFGATGMTSDGTNLVITDAASGTIRTLALSLFPAGGALASAPVPTAVQLPAVAGQFSNVLVNGFNLQTNFEFTSFDPIAMIGTTILVGDDGANQYRLVTLGATAPQSTFTVVAGAGLGQEITGTDGVPATATGIGVVEGLAVDATGGVFFTDGTDITVRKAAAGTVSVVAGIPGRFGSNQPNKVAATTSALSSSMGGLAFSPTNLLHIADTGNNIVRRLNADGTIETVAGIDEDIQGAGGEGSDPLTARLASPHKLAFDANGDLYIAENTSNGRVHVVSKNNIITTVGGGGADSLDYNPTSAFDVSINSAGLALDTAGKIYIGDGSRNVGRISGGLAQVVVGDPIASGYNGDGLSGNQTLLDQPRGVAFDAALGLVICDNGNNRIRAVANLAEATNSAPTAIIVTTPDRLGQAPLKVHFDGSQSVDADGDIVTWEWDFGDGSKGNGVSVDHVFTALGSYTVTLTVTDTQGNTSSIKTVVFASVPMISSSTSGKGAFKVAFGPKAVKPSDGFALAMKNLTGLTNQAGKTAKILIGSFSIDAVVGGKGIKTTSKTVKLLIDPLKKTITLSIKGVKLGTALGELGVLNENTVAPGKSVLIPVVINVNSGALVVGDKFLFFYKAKFNSGASGKFSQ